MVVRVAPVISALFALILVDSARAQECLHGFAQPVRYGVSPAVAQVVADVDGDGAPDLVVSGNQVTLRSTLSLLRNRGDGTFETERLLPTASDQRIEAAADLDGDSLVDLITSDYWNNGIVVHRGRGALTFDAGVFFATATHGGPTRVVDFDSDGRLDLVSFSFGSANPVRVHLFRGEPGGLLAPKRTFETALSVAATPSLRVHSGRPEFLVGNRSAQLGIVRIEADGVAVQAINAGPGLDFSSTFGDVDRDGHADILDTSDGDGASENPNEWIFVTLANPNGGFLERKQLPHARNAELPISIRAADLEGDGALDLLVADFNTPNLYTYRGDGTGTFAPAVRVDAGGPVRDVVAADLNRDGRTDLVTVNADQTVSVILNRGTCEPPRRRAVRK